MQTTRRTMMGRVGWLALAGACLLGTQVVAQEVEPRRWSHLPVGVNFAGVGVAYTEGDIFFDPVLNVADASVELQSYVGKYIRSFELLSRSARIELAGAYQEGRWQGTRDGEQVEAIRSGMADPSVRLAVNLVGAPPLRGKEFANYRAATDRETIVGAALLVTLPLGDYMEDKLINLGGNRYVARTQLGAMHRRGAWAMELTTSLWLWSDNEEFWNGNELEQDPLLSAQGHLIYTARPGLWCGLSGAYGYGGESAINGEEKDDRKSRLFYALSAGLPINRRTGIKLAYVAIRTQDDLGSDTDTVALSASYLW